MQPIRFGKNVIIEVDDSLNNHAGAGVDFWKVEGESLTELFALDVDNVIVLTKWLVNYLSENSEHHKNRKP